MAACWAPGEFIGALLCQRDAIVEPRHLPRALRDHLLAGGADAG
ncbi:MAG TPA: hypothetical protein VH520_00050 [Streptosporangiaceae bacterium]